jgi:hypothetical protein
MDARDMQTESLARLGKDVNHDPAMLGAYHEVEEQLLCHLPICAG